jgi:YjbE family integral membrane protein
LIEEIEAVVDLHGVLDLLKALLSIVVIDLVLSGDNAVVIGMAARQLPPEQRRRAIVLGGVGAVALRVMFTGLVAVLLGIPLLQACGGALLAWIAYKVLRQTHGTQVVEEASTLASAVRTIILADVIMSLDNILAVGGAAHGNVPLLLVGLGLSIPLILFGSSLVATVMNRLPWLVYAGAAILVYTAVEMLLDDPVLRPYYPHTAWFEWGTILVVMLGILGLGYWRNVGHAARPWVVGRRRHRQSRRQVAWPLLERRAELTMQDEHHDQRNSHRSADTEHAIDQHHTHRSPLIDTQRHQRADAADLDGPDVQRDRSDQGEGQAKKVHGQPLPERQTGGRSLGHR